MTFATITNNTEWPFGCF